MTWIFLCLRGISLGRFVAFGKDSSPPLAPQNDTAEGFRNDAGGGILPKYTLISKKHSAHCVVYLCISIEK